jgi:hypothetical protein
MIGPSLRTQENRLEGVSSLRGNYAQRAAGAGKDNTAGAGHSSPHTTLAFYTQSVGESQRNAISKRDAIMFPNAPKFEEGPPLTN